MVLQATGYETAYVGKWHMGEENDDPRPGFNWFVTHKGQGKYFDTEFNFNGQRRDVVQKKLRKWMPSLPSRSMCGVFRCLLPPKPIASSRWSSVRTTNTFGGLAAAATDRKENASVIAPAKNTVVCHRIFIVASPACRKSPFFAEHQLRLCLPFRWAALVLAARFTLSLLPPTAAAVVRGPPGSLAT
jgi:hypothetical protein